jgi:hypothetical protein
MSLTLSDPSREREVRDLAKVREELPEKVLSDLVGEALEHERRNNRPPAGGVTEQEASWRQFVATMSDWSKRLPPGHRLDDGREGIYAGRGE